MVYETWKGNFVLFGDCVSF